MDFTGLLEPQKKHSKKLIDSIYLNGAALDMSHTGCGKTHVACFIAKQLACPVVVICPNNIKHVWRDTLALFGIKNAIIINYELLVRGNTEYLNYDLNKFHATPKWWLSEGLNINFRKDSFVIVDELHKSRGQTSLTCDLVVALKNLKYKVLGLSATAATSVADMKAIGFFANLHNGDRYHEWCTDHGATVTGWGTINWDADQTPAKDGMSRINTNLFSIQKIASRMRREEFGDIFPENRVFADVLDIGKDAGKLQRVYDNMRDEIAMLNERSSEYKDHIFAAIIKARREAELIKAPTAVDLIEDM